MPLVPGAPLPAGLLNAKEPLVVGLTLDPGRLVVVRAARLQLLKQNAESHYTDIDALRKEVLEARRLFVLRGWPVIDVTDNSIEQTAALIIGMLKARTGEQS